MANTSFDVVFQGKLVAGVDPAQVRANLAKLFKADAARIDALFLAPATVIKKGVDETTARNYQGVLAKSGAEVILVPSGAANSPAVSAAPSLPMTIAEPGVILVEPVNVPPAVFDTTAFSLADVGVDLVEPANVVPPKFDLSALTLAPPGVDLVEPTKVTPAQIDTSQLALVER